MTPYKNLSGDSGVAAYEIAPGNITVQFNDGWCYVYTAERSGASFIDKMHRLAEQGEGLAKFISSSGIRDQFVCKYPNM